MKSRFLLFILISLVLISVLPVHVGANVYRPTLTNVYFEKDHVPFNESIRFTINCYGYRCENIGCTALGDNRIPGTYTQDLVFSFFATCPGYGCRIFERHPSTSDMRIDYCSLEGETRQGNFVIPRYADTPFPECFAAGENISAVNDVSGKKYVRMNSRTYSCTREREQEKKRCDQYLITFDRADEKKYNVSDEIYLNQTHGIVSTPAYTECQHAIDQQFDCAQYLETLNSSSLILDDRGNVVSEVCSLRFSLPEGNQTPADPPGHPDFITSISCWFGWFLGRGCSV